MSKISASGQDGATGTRFTLLPESVRKWTKIYDEMNIIIAWDHCLEKVSRPRCSRKNPDGACENPWVEERDLLGRPKQLGSTGQSSRGEKCTGKWFQRDVKGSSQVFRGILIKISLTKLLKFGERPTWND